MKTIVLNGVTYTCPFFDLLPPLSPDERAALQADIAASGITYPVVLTDEREVVDGNHRLLIAAELGLADVPFVVLTGLTPRQKRDRAEDLNHHRRHLTREQRRELIARRLTADPGRSNRGVAAGVGADHKTVAAVRAGLEATGEIPRLPATRGRDGKSRRVKDKAGPDTSAVPRGPQGNDPGAGGTTPAGPAKPAKPARWGELRYFSVILSDRQAELSRAARVKAADRDPESILGVAGRLQAVVDEIRGWVEQYQAAGNGVAS